MTRLSLFQLGLTLEDDDSTEDYTLLVSGGKGLTTWWFLWPKHKRGKPNPSGLRKDAEARHNSVKARHRERTEKEVPALREKRKKNTIVDIT
jgi:hypothetical protein